MRRPPPTLPSGEGATSRVQLEVLEAYRDREILAGCHLGGALPNRLLELSPIAVLALVFAQRVDLQIKRLADIDPDIRLVRSRQVDLLDLVRFQPLIEELGKDESRVGSGDDRVQSGLTGGPVIRMVDVALAAPAAGRIGGDHDVGRRPPDPARDLATTGAGWWRGAVAIGTKAHVV